MKIEFKDASMIDSWIAESDALTQEANSEMAATAQLVEEIRTFSDGTLVDELTSIGNAVLQKAKDLTGTMSEMSSVINQVVSKVSEFVDNVGGFLKGVGGALFG